MEGQTNMQMDKQTVTGTNEQTDRWMDRQKVAWAGKQVDLRQMNLHTNIQTEERIGRKIETEMTNEQMTRPIERLTDEHIERQIK